MRPPGETLLQDATEKFSAEPPRASSTTGKRGRAGSLSGRLPVISQGRDGPRPGCVRPESMLKP